jgi:diguanylate cyclase (GGDEF)-like protein
LNQPALTQQLFLEQLLSVVERIALDGDLSAITPLQDIVKHDPDSLVGALAEAFSRMAVQIEAREFNLECTIEDLRQVKRELELANHDPLTGLPNRVIVQDRLHLALQQMARSGGLVAVLYLDLDRFKWVNDNLGHPAGDELLKAVAERLLTCVRDVDTLARVGGDEFICVLPGLSSTRPAEEVAARFVQCLTEPFALQAGPADIGTSVGIAFAPQHAKDRAELIRLADAAMYQAKHGGRNRYVIYAP